MRRMSRLHPKKVGFGRLLSSPGGIAFPSTVLPCKSLQSYQYNVLFHSTFCLLFPLELPRRRGVKSSNGVCVTNVFPIVVVARSS